MNDEKETAEEVGGPTGTTGPGERRAAALVIFLVLGFIYAVALFLTHQGDTVPSPSATGAAPVAIAEGFRPLSVAFFDEMHGLISGSAPCSNCPGQRGGIIAYTSDGGKTWSVRYRGQRPILGLARVGRTNDVWATATVCDNESFIGCRLFRVHSSDLGQTWAPDRPTDPDQVSPPAPGVCEVDHPYPISSSFVTKERGWMLCAMAPVSSTYQFKGIYETVSGGRYWVRRAHFHPKGATTNLGNLPEDGFAAGISFLSNGVGWLWTVGSHSSLSASSDSGRNWTEAWRPSAANQEVVAASLVAMSPIPTPAPAPAPTPRPSSSPNPSSARPPNPTPEVVGYLVTSGPVAGYQLFITHDGGRSWSQVQSWPA